MTPIKFVNSVLKYVNFNLLQDKCMWRKPHGSTRTLHVQDNVQILREAMPRHRDNSEKLNIEEKYFSNRRETRGRCLDEIWTVWSFSFFFRSLMLLKKRYSFCRNTSSLLLYQNNKSFETLFRNLQRRTILSLFHEIERQHWERGLLVLFIKPPEFSQTTQA